MGPLKKRLALIRPEYVGVDPVDRVVYRPGEITQCDLWFPETKIPVGGGQRWMLPVLVMVLATRATCPRRCCPSRQGGDLLAGMWQLLGALERVSKTLVWDREAAIGGTGKLTAEAAAFAGTLATTIRLAPPRDPEFKGMVERNNGFLETSFLPGRTFSCPADFNTQLADWLPRANSRTVRAIGGRPVDLLAADRAAMLALPPVAPAVGLRARVRLARDYYVRVDTCDYSVDPRVIGRFVEVVASPSEVLVRCGGELVASPCPLVGQAGRGHRPRPRRDRQAAAPRTRRPPRRRSPPGPPPRRRARGDAARPARLRRPVRRRHRRLHPDRRPADRRGRRPRRPPRHDHHQQHRLDDESRPEGLAAQLAYLTRVAAGPHRRGLLGAARRPGPGCELVARGVPRRAAGPPGRRPRGRRQHHAHPHRALPRGQDPRGVQPRPSALAAPRPARPPRDRHLRRQGRERDPARPPGIGKTHLAIGLGIKAAQTGHSVLFDTASNWINRLAAAHHAGALEAELKKIRRYRLIIIDEVGYIRLVHWSQARRVCSPTVLRALAG